MDFLSVLFFLLMFAAVLFLAFVFTRYIAGKTNQAMNGKYIHVIETVSLGLDKKLLLVKAAEQYILIASSGKNLQYLTTIKPEDLDEELSNNRSAPFDFKAIFDKYIGNFKGSKTVKAKKEDIINDQESRIVPDSTFKNNLSTLRTITKRVETNDNINMEDTTKET